MNSYLEYVDTLGLAITPIYFILMMFLLVACLKLGGFSKIESKSFVFVYFFYYLFFVINSFFNFTPTYPDTFLFSKIVEEGFFPEDQSLGVRLFVAATYPIRAFSLYQIETFIVVQIFIFVLSLMFFWRAWGIAQRKKGCDDGSVVCYAFFSCAFPGFLLFVPIPLREFMAVLGMSIFVLGYISCRERIKNGWGYLFLGTLILFVIRPVLIILPFLSLFFLSRKVVSKVVFLAFSFFAVPFFFVAFTNYRFTPQFFAYLRNSANDRYSDSDMVYGVVDWESYLDVMKDLPGLFFQFLLSPMPIVRYIDFLSMKAHFIDAVFCLFVYLLALSCFKKSKEFCFIFALLAAVFSIWEFYIGGAVRHRMPLVAILLPCASYGLFRLCKWGGGLARKI